jgi:hypothetical protein
MEYLFNKLNYLWKFSFYTELVFILFDCTAIYFIYHSRKSYTRILFLIYTISALLLFLATDILFWGLSSTERIGIWECVNLLFSVIEISVFFLFYRGILKKEAFNRFIKVFQYLLIPLFMIMGYVLLTSARNETLILAGYFNVAFYFALLLPPLLYFYKVLRENKELDRKISLLSIWLFTYCIITLVPTVLEGRFLGTPYSFIYRMVIAIHYVALTVLCFLLVVICKRNENKYWTEKKLIN